LYENGAAWDADAVGAHVYGAGNPPDADPAVIEKNPARGGHAAYTLRYLERLHDLMVRYGDDRAVWVTEFGWTSNPDPAYGWQRVSEEQKGEYLARSFRLADARWKPWIGPMFVWVLPGPKWARDDEKFWYGIRGAIGDQAWEVLRREATSGLPGGQPPTSR
jgi:hypothetical protein